MKNHGNRSKHTSRLSTDEVVNVVPGNAEGVTGGETSGTSVDGVGVGSWFGAGLGGSSSES